MAMDPGEPPLHEASLSPLEHHRWFAEEVQPHEPALRTYLQRRFPAITDPDDLVQESFVRLLEAKRKGPIASTRGYLFSIARNTAINRLRRPKVFSEKPLSDFAVQAVVEEECDVVRQVSLRQDVAILLDAIDALPARCREILVLTKLQGIPYQQVADRLGLSVQTVQVQVIRGIRKCTEFLRSRGVLGAGKA